MAQHAEDGFGPTNTEASHEEDQKTKAPPLPLEFLAITKDGGELHRYQEGLTPEDLKKPVKILNGIDQAQWTADGQKLAIVHRDRPCQVDLIGVEDEKVYFSCSGASSVVKFCFSPLQTFLLVCFRHDAAAGQHENFCLYRMQNGEKVLSFTLKQINSNTWPPLRWTSQESYCCRMVTNEVHIFKENTFNLNHPYSRIRCENVVSFSPCREKKKTASDPTSSSSSTSDKRPPPPSSANHPCADQEEKSENKEKTPSSSSTAPPPLTCAVFAVGRKGAPSAVKLFDLEDGSRCVSTKSFFQGNEAQFKWSYDGRAVLAQVHTDASDQSYYGSDALYFLKADGSFDCQLVGAAEGPIHDIQWSPTTLEFLLAKGPVPPEVIHYKSYQHSHHYGCTTTTTAVLLLLYYTTILL
ncbi:eukaryotic translation initiation factor, partial [Cystoisospora suis]